MRFSKTFLMSILVALAAFSGDVHSQKSIPPANPGQSQMIEWGWMGTYWETLQPVNFYGLGPTIPEAEADATRVCENFCSMFQNGSYLTESGGMTDPYTYRLKAFVRCTSIAPPHPVPSEVDGL